MCSLIVCFTCNATSQVFIIVQSSLFQWNFFKGVAEHAVWYSLGELTRFSAHLGENGIFFYSLKIRMSGMWVRFWTDRFIWNNNLRKSQFLRIPQSAGCCQWASQNAREYGVRMSVSFSIYLIRVLNFPIIGWRLFRWNLDGSNGIA